MVVTRSMKGSSNLREGPADASQLPVSAPSASTAVAVALDPTVHQQCTQGSVRSVSDTKRIQAAGSRSRTRAGSTSAAAIAARKLAAEAEFERRRLERLKAQHELEQQAEFERCRLERLKAQHELEQQVEERELHAELAALDAASSVISDKSQSCLLDASSVRTRQWVEDCNKLRAVDPNLTEVLVDADPCNSATRQLQSNVCPATAAHTLPVNTEHNGQSDIAHLANVISNLACQQKPSNVDLIPFHGSAYEWLLFKNTYESTKHSFSAVDNLVRLRHAVRGAARDAVASLLYSATDPSEVVDALELYFGRPELIVQQEVAAIRSLPKLSTDCKEINMFACKVRNSVATIKSLNHEPYLHSPELFQSVLNKLNQCIKSRWLDYASLHFQNVSNSTPKLELLSSFLLSEADKQLKFGCVPDAHPSGALVSPPRVSSVSNKLVPYRDRVHTSTERLTVTCLYCKNAHSIKTCSSFKSLSLEHRWNFIRENKLCYRCLKASPHKWNACRVKPCGIDGCTRRHNQLLHGSVQPASIALQVADNTTGLQSNLVRADESPQPSSSLTVHSVRTSELNAIKVPVSDSINVAGTPSTRARVLLKVVPVVVSGPAGDVETYALLDDGSCVSLIESEVASRIGAVGPRERMRIDGVGGMSRHADVSFVNFYIRGRNLPHSYLVRNARSITALALSSQSVSESDIFQYKHLHCLRDVLCHQEAVPTVLIGASDWFLTIGRELKEGQNHEPTALKTLLGWTLFGPLSHGSSVPAFVNHVACPDRDGSSPTNDSLDALIKSQYHLDSLGISIRPVRHSVDDESALNILESTSRRLESGRFEVGLPWRSTNFNHLPDSYPQAFSRLCSLERQMAKDTQFATAYKAFVKGIIEKGYAEECDPRTYHKANSPTKSQNGPRWYLPHFGVYHPQKKKLRVVHDAAALTKGISLNSLLLTGPDLLQSLLGILFRFREGEVALTADIREMFPQIKIREADRDAQRFLWRENGDPSAPLKEYRMSSMIFGAASSPCTALFIMNKNAVENKDRYPSAAHAVLHDHYMDDFISSEFTVESAKTLASDLVSLHSQCCFEMRAWISNKPEALSSLPEQLLANPTSDINLPSNNVVSALGVKWNVSNDTLGFRIGEIKNEKLTKRSVLSRVMQVYDPLGLITCTVIKGRILIQSLWRERFGWDDELSSKYVDVWNEWLKELASASSVNIPRWYLSGNCKVLEIQLHMFSDASEQAFASVGYWRFLLDNGSVQLALIASKARVAPLKPTSIPRLELQAALISARLACTIKASHRLKPDLVFYWTDSMTVLRWLRSDARLYKPFVAHRVGEISESTDVGQWRWLPSDLNVADDATRAKPAFINSSHRWFSGPSFLLKPSDEWPVEPSNGEALPPTTNVELKASSGLVGFHHDHILFSPPVPDATRFSKWLRLLRATARVIFACRKFRSFIRPAVDPNSKLFSNDSSVSDVTAHDIKIAEQLLLRVSQLESYPIEYECLSTSAPFSKDSRLRKIALCLGEDGLVRLSSRIERATGVSSDMMSPILLNGRHHIVRLILRHYHEKYGHANRETILNEVKQRFSIIGCRNAIKAVARECYACKRRKATPNVPPLGDLPIERLDHHCRPFTNVGLDYFGPVKITVGRRHEKRYVALLTCLVSRALHLEIVSSLSADAAILCLRRFIARRGCPRKLFSDNGTAFVGAHNQLNDFAANHRIEWHFIPPSAPFMGGCWERLVRSVKTALSVTLNEVAPKEEVLCTLLAEAEALVNSRPLTYVTSDPGSFEAITPFHFIIGTSSVSPWLATELNDADLIRRSDWRRSLRLADKFWSRWVKEYLPTLIRRPSAGQPEEWKIGDVVVVVEPQMPRGSWPLGRVTKLHPGADGVVRVLDIAMPNGGALRRPTRRLIRLPVDQSAATP